jgi:hypothetical protein
MTHSTSAKDPPRECAIDGSDTATIFASRLIMKEGTNTQSRMRKVDNRDI